MWNGMNLFGMGSNANNLTPEEVKTKLDGEEKVHLLDVRTPNEFNTGFIAGAELKPSGQMGQWIGDLSASGDREIIVYCHSGARSAQVVRILNENDIPAKNMSGGMLAWYRLQYPVTTNA